MDECPHKNMSVSVCKIVGDIYMNKFRKFSFVEIKTKRKTETKTNKQTNRERYR